MGLLAIEQTAPGETDQSSWTEGNLTDPQKNVRDTEDANTVCSDQL